MDVVAPTDAPKSTADFERISECETKAMGALTDTLKILIETFRLRKVETPPLSYKAVLTECKIQCCAGMPFGYTLPKGDSKRLAWEELPSGCYFARHPKDADGMNIEAAIPANRRHWIQTRGLRRFFCSHDFPNIAGCCFVCGDTIVAQRREADGSESARTRPLAVKLSAVMPYYRPSSDAPLAGGTPESDIRLCEGCEEKHGAGLKRTDPDACLALLKKAIAVQGVIRIIPCAAHMAEAIACERRVGARIKAMVKDQNTAAAAMKRFGGPLAPLAPVFATMSHGDFSKYALLLTDEKIATCSTPESLADLTCQCVSEVIPNCPKLSK